MCEAGHIQDFPWREWVHRSVTPACDDPLKLFASGGASLLGVHVKCSCGKQRNLGGITDADELGGTSVLSDSLATDRARYPCKGKRPWLDDFEPGGCPLPIRGGLRSASNTYFARTLNAIYIPQTVGGVPSALIDLLQGPPLLGALRLAHLSGHRASPHALKDAFPGYLDDFSDAQIDAALDIALNPPSVQSPQPHADLKTMEFEELTRERTEAQLKVRLVPIANYQQGIARLLADVALIDKLRETKVFTGFARLRAKADESDYSQLRRQTPSAVDNWLPASLIHGEGILIQLDPRRVAAWERQDNVVARARRLQERHDLAVIRTHTAQRTVSPRLVLLHSFAHAVIQRLAFESGYGAASLAERIYASEDPPMAAVLIYTAAGDSEGTLGGLVRLGRPGRLEPVLRRALERAEWCSADPICMELGDAGGQGPNSCNAAACHNCALLPETACEDFNRFLDRAVLIGKPGDSTLGYFSGLW